MTDPVSSEALAAARAYEALHVPALFRQFTGPMASAAGIEAGHRVLDVACGTGVLAREAARRVGPDGSVTGLDATPGMLAIARELGPGLQWREGFAQELPFEDRSFDTVVCQFGLMFFPDRVAALREMLRVLVPGGGLAIAVWDSLERSQAYPEFVALLEEMAGTAAADALRAPFVLGDDAQLVDLLREAGATSIEVERHMGTARFPDIQTMVEADLRGWLPVMGVTLSEDVMRRILAGTVSLLARYLTPKGNLEFQAPALVARAAKTD